MSGDNVGEKERKTYHVRIDGQNFKVDTPRPTGDQLLAEVGKRSCAYDLIAQFVHGESRTIGGDEVVDLVELEPRLKDFVTAARQVVTIFINDKPYGIERGQRSVAEILGKVGLTPDAYMLLEEKPDQPPMPLPANRPVDIQGCEVFHTQVQTGGSSARG